ITKMADLLDTAKQKLVLALYGSKAKQVLDKVQGKPGVEVLTFVKREELSFIDVHMASLTPEWVDVCVPSKAVSSVCAGAAILYNGIEASDNWALLQAAGWRVDGANLENDLRHFLASLSREAINDKKVAATRVAADLASVKIQAFEEIYRKLI